MIAQIQVLDVLDPAHTPPPIRVYLSQSAPNPSSGSAVIPFGLPEKALVSCDLFDVAGRRVRQLVRGELPEGHYRIAWDGRDDLGRPLSSGVYFYRLQSGEVVLGNKLILLR